MQSTEDKMKALLQLMETEIEGVINVLGPSRNSTSVGTLKVMLNTVKAFKQKAADVGLNDVDLAIIVVINTLFREPKFSVDVIPAIIMACQSKMNESEKDNQKPTIH